jgi:hypothetical protein
LVVALCGGQSFEEPGAARTSAGFLEAKPRDGEGEVRWFA